ncbi:YicC/YloC family endoribonuclease, partial [Treponema endosymbiont of Eucomonympha sp.]
MTGYAYGEELRPESGFSVEIKSYNAKYCDISVSLPPYLGRLEN